MTAHELRIYPGGRTFWFVPMMWLRVCCDQHSKIRTLRGLHVSSPAVRVCYVCIRGCKGNTVHYSRMCMHEETTKDRIIKTPIYVAIYTSHKLRFTLFSIVHCQWTTSIFLVAIPTLIPHFAMSFSPGGDSYIDSSLFIYRSTCLLLKTQV